MFSGYIKFCLCFTYAATCYIKPQEQKLRAAILTCIKRGIDFFFFFFYKDKFLKRMLQHTYENLANSQTRFKPISSVKPWFGERLEVAVGYFVCLFILFLIALN